MKRTYDSTQSVLGKSLAVRLDRGTFETLKTHLKQDPHREQFAFALAAPVRTADGTVFLVRDLFLPKPEDLEQQSGASVAPTAAFQSLVYLLAQQRNLSLFDIHTHPFQTVPRFSGIDEAVAAKNARYICDAFPVPVTCGLIVFDPTVGHHDAVVFDRSLKAFRHIDRLEILGRPIEVRPTGEPRKAEAPADPQFDRQTRVPGWDQAALARQRVAVVGAGGNGSHVFETLIALGAGTDGWIALIDFDRLEESNLPRIPYARPDQMGSPKVSIAVQYAGRRNPRAKIIPYPCSITDKAVQDRVKGATILIGAGDSDGVRKVCNELAVRYGLAYIDLGCDIPVEQGQAQPGGQVRLVLPGANGCLVCGNGYDAAQAACDLMDERRAVDHVAHGYLRDGRSEATPSVATLNAMTAQLAVTALLSLVCGESFGRWDYVHFNQRTAETLTAATRPRPGCPLCGPEGRLREGDSQDTLPIQAPRFAEHTVSQNMETP